MKKAEEYFMQATGHSPCLESATKESVIEAIKQAQRDAIVHIIGKVNSIVFKSIPNAPDMQEISDLKQQLLKQIEDE